MMQPQPRTYTLPNAAALQAMSMPALMEATLRLSDLLCEESELLRTRRYQEITKLQDEKIQLSALLESYQQLMATNPSFVRDADEAMREELLMLTDDLAVSVQENFHSVSVAKAVNGRVVQAIMDVMSENQRPNTYGASGQSKHTNDMAISMNLNQKA